MLNKIASLARSRKARIVATVVAVLAVGAAFLPWNTIAYTLGDINGTPDAGDYVTAEQASTLNTNQGKDLLGVGYVPVQYVGPYSASPLMTEAISEDGDLVTLWNACTVPFSPGECAHRVGNQPQVFTTSDFDGHTKQHSNVKVVGLVARMDAATVVVCKVPAGLAVANRTEVDDFMSDFGGILKQDRPFTQRRDTGEWTCRSHQHSN